MTRDKTKLANVKFSSLFRFASSFDLFLNFIGLIFSCISGAVFPLTTVTFEEWEKNKYLPKGATPLITADIFMAAILSSTLSFIYLGVGTFVLTYLFMGIYISTSERITYKIRVEYLKAVLRQDIQWYDNEGPGEVATRISSDTLLIQDGIGEKIPLAASQIATCIAGFVIAFIKSWQLTLALMAMFPLIAISGAVGNIVATKYQIQILNLYSKAGNIADECFSCIRTVVAFNGQVKMSKMYNQELISSRILGIKKATSNGISLGITLAVIYLGYALAFFYGAQLLNWKLITPGAVFFAILIGAFSLAQLAPDFQAFALARGAAAKIYYTIDRQPSIISSKEVGETIEDIKGAIEIKDLFFSYPSRPDVPILSGFNLQIVQGQSVALVGASGSGKSTIIQLVERFYDPISGSVLIDGVDIKSLKLKWMRQQIGYVQQEPTLFEGTVEENVAHGLIGTQWENASLEDRQTVIKQACVQANAHDFIMKLPEGYNTQVGQRGLLLSGGQKQRICISRAICKNPRILLLDEATSALDTNSERIVQDALDRASKGRTTITIAHRLSTIRNADKIVVMNSGVIVEVGTHNELVKLDGFYKKLVDAQKLNNEEIEKLPVVEDPIIIKADDVKEKELERKESMLDIVADIESSKKKRVNSWKTIGGILRLNYEDLKFLIPGFLGAIAAGLIYPFFAIIFGTLIGVFTKIGPELIQETNFWALMFVAIAAATFVANLVMNAMFGYASEYLTERIRRIAFFSLLRQDISFYDDTRHGTGILTSSLSSDAQKIQGISGLALGNISTVLVNLVGCVIVAFINYWKLSLVAVCCLPLLVFTGYFRLKIVSYYTERAKSSYEKSAQLASEAVSAIRTIQSLTREDDVAQKYMVILDKPLKDGLKSAWTSTLMYAASSSANFLVNALIFWYGGYLIAYEDLPVSQMFTVFIAIVFGSQSAGRIFSFAPDFGKALEAGENILALLESRPLVDSQSTLGDVLVKSNGEIEFRDVHFKYPTRPDVRVLNGLNIHVKNGQFIALVGPSGCGKSTTVGLIERFYDPIRGGIFLDGKNIADLNVSKYRDIIGLVSQEPNLFDLTIAENIAFGCSEPPSQELIENAAKMANIHSFIEGLPDGYNTSVGIKGSQLSGGQKQRIAIARALIRDPKVLLLDEATSALDAESEVVVQHALDNASKGRTTIAIAHRLSSIQNADKIYVIVDGVVKEEGNHHDLLEKRGMYYELVQFQDLEKKQ